jgi:3-dehydroquinate dehydratase-1
VKVVTHVDIAVTIAPENKLDEETLTNLKQYNEDIDIIELRIDQWNDIDVNLIETIQQQIKDLNKRLLITYRTSIQGGNGHLNGDAYYQMLNSLIEVSHYDLIDIEFDKKSDKEQLASIISAAQNKDLEVVLSYHDFEQTPKLDELKHLYYKMQSMSPDYIKVAVMPKNKQDVTNLLMAMSDSADSVNPRVIGIAMSKLGLVTRTAQGVFGGTVSYGCLDTPKAPGQVHVSVLREQLKIYE